ncbi:MAG TPA: peptidylprolyl isomerase [Tetrasphaera sp.]|uniref:peptidylprolyl isomerase n=1 Tax=Nostocoides sp. TaxID=1917966 RepID=UPI002CFD66A7|nr:peptidylprolyl isomerase [Tetrasphaera sp.]HNQ08315.1 peptidylprolyl isomerase [Tetrasphaera sp.]
MTKEQERARAKRRYVRQQDNAAQQRVQRQRNRQIAAVVAVFLALVAGLIWLVNMMGSEPTAASRTPGLAATVADGCIAAPAVPGTGATLDKPDAAQIAKVTGKTVTATIETNCGRIVLSLDGAKAPTTVASFVQLAQQNYWKNAPCHRLTTSGIFVLQCGDPTGTGNGGPGYGYGIENAPADAMYPRGTVAMARTADPNSNGGQFFIVYKDSTIDASTGGYSIFGTVTQGLDIVDKIAAGGVGNGVAPTFPISFLSVTTETKG